MSKLKNKVININKELYTDLRECKKGQKVVDHLYREGIIQKVNDVKQIDITENQVTIPVVFSNGSEQLLLVRLEKVESKTEE